MSEKAKGKAKEAYGAVAGDEGKKAEGQAQQRKENAREEREQHKRTKPSRTRPTAPRSRATSRGARTRAVSWATFRPTRGDKHLERAASKTVWDKRVPPK